jgi:deazaflavin-dependent oxidoreductase (nitroreductase family)
LSQPSAPPRRTPWWAGPFRAAHIALYRATGGVLGHQLGAQRTLLLTTIGRRSGQPRTLPVTYFALDGMDGAVALVASNWGNDAPPAWYLNLLAQPHARVQLKRKTFPAVASVATAEERARFWPQIIARNPQHARYQVGTAREIPVVLLRRASARDDS